jgi:soluble lytic murein transglycosylase-like protein
MKAIPPMRAHATLLAALAVLSAALLTAWPLQASAALPPRYACTLIDDSVRVLSQDLALAFKQAVRGCWLMDDNEVIIAPAAAPLTWRPGPSPVLPAELPSAASTAPAAPAALPQGMQAIVHRVSLRYGMDPNLVSALVHVESRGQPSARSPKGALGLMQIMPGTGRRYGVRSAAALLEPATNVDAGVRYLRDLMSMFPGRVDLALAAYNAGEGAVLRHGRRVPPYAETQAYVQSVLARYRSSRVVTAAQVQP